MQLGARFFQDVIVVPISGRKTEDLRDRIGIKDIVYSGNHGLEMSGLDRPQQSGGKPGKMEYNLNEEELSKLRGGIKSIVTEMKEKKLGKEVKNNDPLNETIKMNAIRKKTCTSG